VLSFGFASVTPSARVAWLACVELWRQRGKPGTGHGMLEPPGRGNFSRRAVCPQATFPDLGWRARPWCRDRVPIKSMGGTSLRPAKPRDATRASGSCPRRARPRGLRPVSPHRLANTRSARRPSRAKPKLAKRLRGRESAWRRAGPGRRRGASLLQRRRHGDGPVPGVPCSDDLGPPGGIGGGARGCMYVAIASGEGSRRQYPKRMNEKPQSTAQRGPTSNGAVCTPYNPR